MESEADTFCQVYFMRILKLDADECLFIGNIADRIYMYQTLEKEEQTVSGVKGRVHLLLFAFILMTSCQMNCALYYSGRKGSFPRLGKRKDSIQPQRHIATRSDNREGRSNKILRRLYEIIGRLDRDMNVPNLAKFSRSFSK